MPFDITHLSEDELLELNRRVVERIQFIQSAKNVTRLAQFSVGMTVEFALDDGRAITGTVARLNQKTATVVTAAGRWRVSPALLRPVSQAQGSNTPASRIVAMPRRRDLMSQASRAYRQRRRTARTPTSPEPDVC